MSGLLWLVFKPNELSFDTVMNQVEAANAIIQALPKEFTTYKILNAMLNCVNGLEYEPFLQTQQIIAQEILQSQDLETLAFDYDDFFLMPMRGWSQAITTKTEKEQDAEFEALKTLVNAR